MAKLTGAEIAADGPRGWTFLLNTVQTSIAIPTYADGLALVADIGAAAEKQDHHPDLVLHHDRIGVRLSSHDVGAVTRRDLRLARTITDLAESRGLSCRARGVSALELGLDTPDGAALGPFWAAALGMSRQPSDGSREVIDDRGALPTVWFQQSGSDEPRQRWHLDLWVDPDDVQPRIDAALAAGGTLVSDDEAPAFWVLADPEGNKICLCTWQSRD